MACLLSCTSILLSVFGRGRPDMPSGHPDIELKNGKSGSDVR
jgi:hypothetical protein